VRWIGQSCQLFRKVGNSAGLATFPNGGATFRSREGIPNGSETVSSVTGKMPSIIHAGLDESGSLTAATPWFIMAAVFSSHPEEIKDLIRRAALHSGKKLKRERKLHGELKWHNASERVRNAVLYHLGQADVAVYSLAVRKDGRKIDDTPENYAILACELLRHSWHTTPSVALSLDRHFTSPAHIAAVNTAIHRHWPAQGVLSIVHVDSERSPLVQLTDFVAGSVYEWHKVGDPAVDLIQAKMSIAAVEDWRQIKARWMKTM